MRKIFAFLAVFLYLFSIVGVAAQDEIVDSSADTTDSPETSPETADQEEQAPMEAPIQEFNADAGTLPDSPFYFVDNLVEQVMVGDNPERALEYKEEKIAEAQAMMDIGKTELAQEVLDKALNYGDIVESEVSPEMKDDVQESSAQIQVALENMKTETEDVDVEENIDAVIEKEKKIDTAAELVSKIGELCDALAKLDPLQYADTCKSKGTSPKWMKEQDKEITKEQESQAKLFFEKLSQCFESPEQCDCKGMGVQSFEDFCIEKSESASACFNGDESSCKLLEQSDPSDLLPSYLLPVFEKVSSKYMGAKMNLYMPEECTKAGATTSQACSEIMFNLNSPQECIDAGLTGESRGDEIKCRQIMFKTNTPQECIDAGIIATDPDAPRKCSKIMFALRAPQECIDAGITGESRDDQVKCANFMGGMGNQMSMGNGPRFNKDCKAITDTAEKIKCFEEFYNNAQVNTREDFAQRAYAVDQNTGEKISSEEEQARQECISKGMGTILEYENGQRIIICVDKTQVGSTGMMCQSKEQIETLRQDCINRGQGANVEMRNGCPWVICVSQGYNTQQQMPQTISGGGSGVAVNNVVNSGTSGMKCPDGICDDYERMNPYACPMDCGGAQMVQQVNQQQLPQQGQMIPAEQIHIGDEAPVQQQPTATAETTPPLTEPVSVTGSSGESTSQTEQMPITGQAVNPYLAYYWS